MGKFYVEETYRRICKLTNDEASETWTVRFYIQTLCWFTATVVVAILVPGFEEIANFIGIPAFVTVLAVPGYSLVKMYSNSASISVEATEMEERHKLLMPEAGNQNNQSNDNQVPKTTRMFLTFSGYLLILICVFVAIQGIVTQFLLIIS